MNSEAKQIIINIISNTKAGSTLLNYLKAADTKCFFLPRYFNFHSCVYIYNKNCPQEETYDIYDSINYSSFKIQNILPNKASIIFRGQTEKDLIELPRGMIESVLEVSNFI